ncbi:lysyl-tRNA synthetase [Streptococcus pneumoniae]|uniref:lysyl-tRNA synthetase n=1 Tax=Streptococcus pneumoniae TaxID=1313 RepID=UPI001263802B|nr:lysyl-tRNA synthetase [Streptococcus pneumoniae]
MRLWIELTESVSYTYGKAKLTWFEEIFEEYKMMGKAGQLVFFDVYRLVRQVS